MRILLNLTILAVFLLSSCDKEQASLDLISGKSFDVGQIILTGPDGDLVLNPAAATIFFNNCDGDENTDNNCNLEFSVGAQSTQLSYQAAGESNNEFVTIRSAANPTEDADFNALTDLMAFTFRLGRVDNGLELSCTDCSTVYEGISYRERTIRLNE